MKKVVAVLVAMATVLSVSGKCTVVQAASEDVWEVRTTETVLSEMEVINGVRDDSVGDILMSNPDTSSRGSYTEKVLQCTHDIYVNGNRVFSVEEACTVWYYTDGKVHLYRRTLTGISWMGTTGTVTYGSIVNTDGSRSYTSGDRVLVTRYATSKTYSIDFYVTGSDYNFSMHEIN